MLGVVAGAGYGNMSSLLGSIKDKPSLEEYGEALLLGM